MRKLINRAYKKSRAYFATWMLQINIIDRDNTECNQVKWNVVVAYTIAMMNNSLCFCFRNVLMADLIIALTNVALLTFAIRNATVLRYHRQFPRQPPHLLNRQQVILKDTPQCTPRMTHVSKRYHRLHINLIIEILYPQCKQ